MHCIRKWFAGARVDGPEHLLQRASQGFIDAPACMPLRRGIHAQNAAFHVGGNHAVADGFQRDRQILLAAPQRRISARTRIEHFVESPAHGGKLRGTGQCRRPCVQFAAGNPRGDAGQRVQRTHHRIRQPPGHQH